MGQNIARTDCCGRILSPLVTLHQYLHAAGAHLEYRDPFDQMLAKPVQVRKTSPDEQELGVPFIKYSVFVVKWLFFRP